MRHAYAAAAQVVLKVYWYLLTRTEDSHTVTPTWSWHSMRRVRLVDASPGWLRSKHGASLEAEVGSPAPWPPMLFSKRGVCLIYCTYSSAPHPYTPLSSYDLLAPTLSFALSKHRSRSTPHCLGPALAHELLRPDDSFRTHSLPLSDDISITSPLSPRRPQTHLHWFHPIQPFTYLQTHPSLHHITLSSAPSCLPVPSPNPTPPSPPFSPTRSLNAASSNAALMHPLTLFPSATPAPLTHSPSTLAILAELIPSPLIISTPKPRPGSGCRKRDMVK